MPYSCTRDFIQTLQKEQELLVIKDFVSPELEISEINDRLVKNQGPAVLFENTGTEFPVLVNAMGSEKRICLALGTPSLDDFSQRIENLFKMLMKPRQGWRQKISLLPGLGEIASWMPVRKRKKGLCQQCIMEEPDITRLPVLKTWPYDGGPFVTLPVVHTQDPHTGQRNVGMYRMQVFGPKLTGMHWHRHKGSAKHFNAYKKLGKKMPVVVTLGGDPVYTYAATAPMPDNFDEYLLAGFLRRKKVELVRCLTQDIWVPADVDFVIEGYVDPDEALLWEGPFGDHTGFYSLADWYPGFHITCITHRKDAVYPATVVGIPPQEDGWIGKATERIFLAPIKLTLAPEVLDIYMPEQGVFHNLVIVKIQKEYPGQGIKVMNALWGAGQMMFTKTMVVVDQHTDIHNHLEVLKAIALNTRIDQDIIFFAGPMDVLDHTAPKPAHGGKTGIDACSKLPEETLGEPHPNLFNGSRIRALEQLLKEDFTEITGINTHLIQEGLPFLILGVNKNKKGHIQDLHPKLMNLKEAEGLKAIFYMEAKADIHDLEYVLWRGLNNLDPVRDHLQASDIQGAPCLGFDAGRKFKEWDNFSRPWPNIVCMDTATVNHIDQNWKQLTGLPPIVSPSAKFIPQAYSGEAIAE